MKRMSAHTHTHTLNRLEFQGAVRRILIEFLIRINLKMTDSTQVVEQLVS